MLQSIIPRRIKIRAKININRSIQKYMLYYSRKVFDLNFVKKQLYPLLIQLLAHRKDYNKKGRATNY